jgi:hypothetical protein
MNALLPVLAELIGGQTVGLHLFPIGVTIATEIRYDPPRNSAEKATLGGFGNISLPGASIAPVTTHTIHIAPSMHAPLPLPSHLSWPPF